MLVLLDIFLTILHIALVVFNLTGWIWKRTRRLHLLSLALTAASWFALGPWYGWGYCPLTDWHWEVKHQLGETNLPQSFIKYIADQLTGLDIPARIVDRVTLAGLLFAVVAALVVNVKNKKPPGKNRAA